MNGRTVVFPQSRGSPSGTGEALLTAELAQSSAVTGMELPSQGTEGTSLTDSREKRALRLAATRPDPSTVCKGRTGFGPCRSVRGGHGHVPGHVCSGVGHQRHLLAPQHRVLVNLHGLCTEGETRHPTPCLWRGQGMGKRGLVPFGSERRLSQCGSHNADLPGRINTAALTGPNPCSDIPTGPRGWAGDPGPTGTDTRSSRGFTLPASTHAHRPRGRPATTCVASSLRPV